MSDPIALKITQSVVNICLKILSALKSHKEKREKAEWQKLVDNLQATKPMTRMVGENLSRSLHTLGLPDSTIKLLTDVDGDFTFHNEAARLLSQGELTAGRMVVLLKTAYDGFNLISEAQLSSMAAFWIESIQLYVAKTPELSGALQLRMEARIIESQDEIRKDTSDILTDTNSIRRSQEQLSASMNVLLNLVQQQDESKNLRSSVAETLVQRQFQSRFERCRNGLISGSVPEATSQFELLIEDLRNAGELGCEDLLFRSLLNYSSCLLHLERHGDASRALDEAEKMLPADARLLRHRAMSLAHFDKPQEALELIRKLRTADPGNIKDVINEMSLLQQLGRGADLTELLEGYNIKEVEFQCQKAYALLYLERVEEAKAAAEWALEAAPDNEVALLVFAYSNAFSILERHQAVSRRLTILSKEELQALNVSIEASMKAYGVVQKRGRLALMGEVQGNILAFYFYAKRDDDALRFAAQVSISPRLSEITLNNLFALFVRRNCAAQAIEAADALVAKLPSVENRLRRAYALSMAQSSALALEELIGIRFVNEEVVNDPKWVVQIARCHLDQHQSDKAIEILGEFLARFPSCVEVKLELADYLDDIGHHDQALSCYEQAQAMEPENELVAVECALFLMRTERWADGIQQLKKIGADSILSPLFAKYLICAYNTKCIAHCLMLVEEWVDDNSTIHETIYSIGARCAFEVRDLSLAKKYLEVLMRIKGKHDVDHKRMLSQVYLSLSDHEEAYTLLRKVVTENASDSKSLSLLGSICSAQQKHEEALDSHIRAIRIDPLCVEARSAFFASMLLLPEKFSLADEFLRLHHENISFLTSHPCGVLRTVRFIGDDGDPDFSEMQKMLESRERAVNDELHDDGQSPRPLAILARNLGASLYDAWAAFSSGRERGIRMCSGTQETQQEQFKTAEVGGDITVDLVALLSFHSLGRLDLLPKLFNRVYVHVSALDSVVNDLRNTRLFPGKGSIASVSGQLVYTETNSDRIQRKILALSEVLDFIKSQAVFICGVRQDVSYASLIDIGQENEVLEMLMEPALLAKERNTSILSDDLIFRMFAGRIGVSGFCTQSVLRLALKRAFLSQEEYQACVGRLIEMDYYFVSYDTDTLKYIVEGNSVGGEAILDKVLKATWKPGCATPSAAQVLAEFLAWSRRFVGDPKSDRVAGKILEAVLGVENVERAFIDHFVGWLSVCLRGAPTWFTDLIVFWISEFDGKEAKKLRILKFAEGFARAHGRGATGLRVRPLCRQWREQSKLLKDFQVGLRALKPARSRRSRS